MKYCIYCPGSYEGSFLAIDYEAAFDAHMAGGSLLKFKIWTSEDETCKLLLPLNEAQRLLNKINNSPIHRRLNLRLMSEEEYMIRKIIE